jgi:hypothetical protein
MYLSPSPSPEEMSLARLSTTDRFHVHIVNANHTGLVGMIVGQAHMLDDIISLVRVLACDPSLVQPIPWSLP